MANGKRNRRSRQRPEPPPAETCASCAVRIISEVLPLLRCSKLPGRRSAQHLRVAAH